MALSFAADGPINNYSRKCSCTLAPIILVRMVCLTCWQRSSELVKNAPSKSTAKKAIAKERNNITKKVNKYRLTRSSQSLLINLFRTVVCRLSYRFLGSRLARGILYKLATYIEDILVMRKEICIQ
jgi:hypothetical protein